MQLPLSEADSEPNAVQFMKPTPHISSRNTTTAAHTSLPVAHHNLSLDQFPSDVDHTSIQASDNAQALEKAEPFAVVKQTINDLEEQGLLMLFDRQDQVAKRLTGELIAAGVLQEDLQPSESREYSR